MVLIVKFLGLALACCIAVKVLAAVVTPAIPVLAVVFAIALVATMATQRSKL